MLLRSLLIAFLSATALLSGAVLAQPTPGPTPVDVSIMIEDSQYQFRTESGFALYVFDQDDKHKSVCNDQCADTWPPLIATAAATVGDWKSFSREDGAFQWSYKGKPVYTYSKDKAGMSTGDGVGGVWHKLIP